MYVEESLPRLRNAGVVNYREVPKSRTILAVTQRLLDHGQFTVPTHAQGRGGPRLAVGSEEEIFAYFEENPRRSTNEAARHFGLSQYVVWKLLNTAGLRPYHYQPVQALHPHDSEPRQVFCRWLLENANENVLWTDEALFTRVGIYNVHNEHWWSAYTNPHKIKENHHQERFSVNVWAGVFKTTVIGPIFIEGHLTGGTYLDMLQGVIQENIEDELPIAAVRDRNFYFMQDGAPPHYAISVRQYLNQRYGQRWIGRSGPVQWPARSPDLTPCDFFLWGEIKRLVYVEEAQTREDLKRKIVSAFDELKSERYTSVLTRLEAKVQKRARLCLECEGCINYLL